MLYHFGTRNLSFLKSATLRAVLENLAAQPTARAACAVAGVPEPELPSYARALATLASSNMIVPRGAPAPQRTAPPSGLAGGGYGAVPSGAAAVPGRRRPARCGPWGA